MSEVLLISPSPLARDDADSVASSTDGSRSNPMGSSCSSLTTTVFDEPTHMSLPVPIEVEEQYCRGTLLIECELERLNLTQWHIALREQRECKRLRLRAADVAVQEALLLHRMERFAYLEQRYGHPPKSLCASDTLNATAASVPQSAPAINMRSMQPYFSTFSVHVNTSTPLFRAFFQDELFSRELISLDATRAWMALWSAMRPLPVTAPSPVGVCVGRNILSPSHTSNKQLERMRRDATSVCDEAESLSFVLDDMQKRDACPAGPNDHPAYPVAVMRAATELVDDLRRRVYSGAKRRTAAEQALRSANQRADAQAERVRALKRIIHTAEEAAAVAVTECQLRLPAAAAKRKAEEAEEEDAETAASQNADETYIVRVLQELRSSLTVQQRQLQWQEDRARRELRDRESVLEMVYVQTSRLAALLRQILGPSAPAMLSTGGEVSLSNVAGVLESVIAGVVALRDDGSRGFLQPSLTNSGGEEASKRTIAQMQRRIDRLVADQKNPGGANVGMNPDSEDSHVLLMVMRQLQEVRGEKLALELALESRRERRPFLHSPAETRANANGAEDSHETREWVQTVHTLREDNALLREEVRLEQEARQALATQLKAAERFVRDMQRQCRRLRLSSRNEEEAYEVIQSDACGGAHSDDSDEDSECTDGNDSADLESAIVKHKGRAEGEDAFRPQARYLPSNSKTSDHFSNYKNNESSIDDSVSPYKGLPIPRTGCQVTSTTLSSEASNSISATSLSLSPAQRAVYRACRRDHRRLANALRAAHGLYVCTIARARDAPRSTTPDGSSMFAGCAISLHVLPRSSNNNNNNNVRGNNNSSNINNSGVRHIAVLYPLPPALAARPSLTECIRRTRGAARGPKTGVEVIDLRAEFAHAEKYLRGCMDVCVSPDGRFVYALLSADDDALARLCSPTALHIPPERRFRFASAISISSNTQAEGGGRGGGGGGGGGGREEKVAMDALGWCGRGVCAWAVDAMRFESPAEQQRFERHIRKEYEVALWLSAEETQRGAGGCVEMVARTPIGKGVRRLFMSVGAYEGLSVEHRAQLTQWYGPNGIATVGMHNIEREMGAPLRRLVVAAQWHGDQSLANPPPRDTLKMFGFQWDKK